MIGKEDIQKEFDRCVRVLDKFGDKEIKAAGLILGGICPESGMDTNEDIDRVSIFVYLSRLKNNEQDFGMLPLYIRMHSIYIAFAAIMFTMFEYSK